MMDTQAIFSKALRALQSHDFAAAQRLLKGVIEKQPRHVAALNLLAVALMSTDRYAEAEGYVSRALRLDQSSDVSFYNYGLILKKLNRPEEALAQFDRALKLNRNVCETWNNRGSALNDLGRHEEALSAFDTAISLNSRYVEALYNRARTFALLNLHPDALAGFHATLGLRPDFAEAWLGCGNSHFALAQYGESLSAFQRAASLQPASADSWFGSANALARLDRPEEAVTAYDRAISLKPEFAVAWMNRAYVLLDLNRQDDARRAFDKAVAIDPTLTEARFSSCVAALPVVYSSADEILLCRSAYEKALTAFSVSACAAEKDVAQKIWGRLPFLLTYQGYNDRDLQKLYGSMASRIMADAFPAPSLARSPQFDRPVRVGFVSAHFHSHSNWKIPIKGWIGQLDRTRFQIFGYHVGERRDAETDVAKRMCHQFIEGARTVENWRQQIVVDEVDVLIYPGLFMDRISTQLAAQRLAPVQCNSWGHPDTSGMPTLDFFLSSDLMEPAGATAHYTEELVRLPNLSIYCEPIELAPSMMTRGQLAIRDDASVFWCGQSTQKYLPQDDQVFIRIAQQVPNSQFLFLHHQYLPSASRLLQHRLDVAFASAGLRGRDHCVFLDALSFPDYIATMGICDVFLDSLGWSGCNSTLESLTHNLPVVTLPSGLMRGRHSAAILRMMGVTETIARTVDEYVAIAARLGNNPAERLWLRDAIARQKYRIYRDRACIEALEDFLEREGRPCGGSRPL